MHNISIRSTYAFFTTTENTYHENTRRFKPTVPLQINTYIYVDQNRNHTYTKKFNDNYFYNYSNMCAKRKQQIQLLFLLTLLTLNKMN